MLLPKPILYRMLAHHFEKTGQTARLQNIPEVYKTKQDIQTNTQSTNITIPQAPGGLLGGGKFAGGLLGNDTGFYKHTKVKGMKQDESKWAKL